MLGKSISYALKKEKVENFLIFLHGNAAPSALRLSLNRNP